MKNAEFNHARCKTIEGSISMRLKRCGEIMISLPISGTERDRT